MTEAITFDYVRVWENEETEHLPISTMHSTKFVRSFVIVF